MRKIETVIREFIEALTVESALLKSEFKSYKRIFVYRGEEFTVTVEKHSFLVVPKD
jgi:hypothetical protein